MTPRSCTCPYRSPRWAAAMAATYQTLILSGRSGPLPEFAARIPRSVTEARLRDIAVTHAEVVRHFVEHGIGHLIDEFGAGRTPVFDVALEQDDPLRILEGAEGRVAAALVEAEHMPVDVVVAIVIGELWLDDDHQIVLAHSGA